MREDVKAVEEVALYYPGSQPPAGWIRRSLLMSDRLTSIVHPDLISQNPPADLAVLSALGLWTGAAVTSLATQSQNYASEVERALDKFAERPEYRFAGGQYPPLAELTRLYLGKLDDLIDSQLLEKSLAKLGRYGGTVTVHREVAAVILAITAKYVAALNLDQTVRILPSTDVPRAIDYAYEPFEVNGHLDRHLAQQLLLDGLIPQPADHTPITTIVEFRKQHADELLCFRVEIARLMDEVQRAESPLDAIRSRRETIEVALKDVIGAARGRSIQLMLGSAAVVALGLGGTVLPETTPLWQAFGGIGATAAAGVAGMWIRGNQLPAQPYSYLAAARQRYA